MSRSSSEVEQPHVDVRAIPTDVPIVMYLDAAEMGGGATHTLDLATGFRSRGYRVAVLCHRSDDLAPLRIDLEAVGADVCAVEDWDLTLAGRVKRALSLVGAIRRYRGCLLLLMIGNYRSGGPVTIAGVVGGATALVRTDMQPPMPPISWRHRLSIRLKDLFIDRVIVNSAQNRDSFAEDMGRSARKIEVVRQGIDLARFVVDDAPPRRKELGSPPDDVVIGAISRLGGDVWRKGIDRFVEAAARVARTCPRARFVVIGDGGAKPNLQKSAEALGLTARMEWLGWRGDIPGLLAGMDVFVMPSLYEGTPTILLEAMATGCAVVASRVGAVPEIVMDGINGLSVAPDDVEGLAQAIARLVGDSALRQEMGVRARELARRSFSRELMVDGYLSVFANAYRRPGPLGVNRLAV